ncbi:hypothetical protein BaRGS_00025119 [Batillaria attramentaria]|uniref:PPM-type phosphatase domain-containing protein n=1 Tax=Batillaria attramentaria TaxID=370345 RepID=A0ABD0K987_9CAEN
MFSSFRNKLKRGDSKQNPQGRRRSATTPDGKRRSLPERQQYRRPEFLKLTEEQLAASVNFETRPILIPNNQWSLPWKAGYAECIHAGGKSKQNEDQAAVGEIRLELQVPANTPQTLDGEEESPPTTPNGNQVKFKESGSLRAVYFGVFDGHAGAGVSLMVADQFINHLQEKLVEARAELFRCAYPELYDVENNFWYPKNYPKSLFTVDNLVTGALEAAFQAMDEQIARESVSFYLPGGCTALVALFILGKLYIANAGDCRAVIFTENETMQMSEEFTPDRERERINLLGYCRPDLLHGLFTYKTFWRMPRSPNEVGKKMLCRGPMDQGWHYETVTTEDLGKLPLVPYVDDKKWAPIRLMGTIGVTRGFGDFDLFEPVSRSVPVKPFLSCVPEVTVIDLRDRKLTAEDVLVIGSDGLWDRASNKLIGAEVRNALASQDVNREQLNIYCHAAERVLRFARGTYQQGWKQPSGREASFDDLTAFVIPLHEVVQVTSLSRHSPEN